MQPLEEHCAAMAANMIDDEIASIVRRLPPPDDQAPFHRAIMKEAERRGLVERD